MQDRIFYSICFGFIFGVLLRSFIFVNFYVALFIAFISIIFFLFFKFISENKWGIAFGVFGLVFSLGIIRFSLVDAPYPAIFESYLNKEVYFSGIIIDEPNVTEKNQKLIVSINEDNKKTRVLLSVNLGQDFKYGDLINFKGILEKSENFLTDQGKNFDYINYLKKDGIFYIMKYPKVETLSNRHGNFLKGILFSIKEKFLNKINLTIREPESLLMGGLILGEKSNFNESLRKSFIDTGTIHIVALSGYNVTIVAEWIMKIFYSFPKNIGIGAGIISILLFVLMTGGSSTAIRAGIMASIALFARLIGRNYDVVRALIITGLLMVFINPFILVFDVSFQLSFISTIAVIFFTPKIEKYFLWITKSFNLRDIISVTFACYIFVLPFVLYKMGNLSLVALPTNILILPLIPFTMILGFITGIMGMIWYIFAIPFGMLAQFLLQYELGVINFFSNIPFASLTIPNFPLFITISIYIYFIYKLFGKSIKSFFTVGEN